MIYARAGGAHSRVGEIVVLAVAGTLVVCAGLLLSALGVLLLLGSFHYLQRLLGCFSVCETIGGSRFSSNQVGSPHKSRSVGCALGRSNIWLTILLISKSAVTDNPVTIGITYIHL